MSKDYEWDRTKASSNLQKHGVDFAEAALALTDPMALTMPDPDSYAEERFLTLGADPQGKLLVVAYAWRGDTARIISARKATPRERRQYQEG